MIMPDEHIGFSDWVNSLRVDFSTQDTIPFVENEENWREIGNMIANSSIFIKAGAPRTDSFEDWRTWGKMLYSRFG